MRKSMLCVSLAALMAATACGQGGDSAEAQAAQLALSPEDVSADALKGAVKDERVRRFYEARQWQAVWTDDRAEALMAALKDAPRHGLSGDQFRKEAAAEESPAAREAALTFAALTYADALANGLADPGEVREIYSVPMPKVDVVAGVAKALEAKQLQPWLASLAPQDAEYKALSEAFLRYSEQAARGQSQSIPAGETIHKGDSDARVPAIAAALRANGYLAEAPAEQPEQAKEAKPAKPDLFTPAMAAAVERLQEDYGLKADGIVGPSTLERLNTGAAERARILAINLDRRRWLDRTPPATRIDVNTAAAMLDYWHDGAHAHRTRVVVGQPGSETPQLGSPIMRLVANPNWTVPKSIAEEEIIPKGRGYMAAHNMSIKNGRVVQEPGPDSALGLVKFDMDNPHAIYLHDTPAKSLFESSERHASHGCVRVQDAVGFARMVAQHEGKLEEFSKAMARQDETYVELPEPIPVRLMYHTAFVGPDGRVLFRPDPYGWDEDLARALGLEVRERGPAPVHVSLPGP
jgi:murein L,D-transpeptidase YcbB/YkuD